MTPKTFNPTLDFISKLAETDENETPDTTAATPKAKPGKTKEAQARISLVIPQSLFDKITDEMAAKKQRKVNAYFIELLQQHFNQD